MAFQLNQATLRRLQERAEQLKLSPDALLTTLLDESEGVPKSYNQNDSFFDLSLDLLCVATPDGYFKRLNQAWETTLGYTVDELLSKPFIEFVHPEDRAITTAELHTQTKAYVAQNFVNRYRCQDGSYRWLEWVSCYDPETDLIYGVARDVTERRQIEVALRQNEQLLRDFLNASRDIAFMTDTEGQIINFNDNFVDRFGKSSQTLVGESIYNLLSPEDAQHRRQFAEQVIVSGKPVHFYGQYLGLSVDKTIYPIFDKNGKVIRLVSFVHDITPLKQTENALLRSEERFRNVIEYATEGILLVNHQGEIVLVNRRIESQFGYSRDELLGKSVEILLPENRRQAHVRYRQEYLRNPVARPMGHGRELFARRKNGSEFPVEVSLSYIQDGDDLLVLCFVVDITERKQLERQNLITRQLEIELQKERELIDLKERFMSMVSHEFRTPLSVMATACDILERYYPRFTQEQIMERLHGLRFQVDQVTGMLNDILLLSKSRAGKLEFNPAPLDLESYWQNLMDRVRLADNERHRFSLQANGIPETIMADKKLLDHIFTNLLSNALKYSPPGSEIVTRLSKQDNWLVFQVIDKGIGIPEADQKRIFEVFHRARNVGEVQGSGLGLAIVQESVQAHGGSVTFNSIEGQGTTFTVRLPLSE